MKMIFRISVKKRLRNTQSYLRSKIALPQLHKNQKLSRSLRLSHCTKLQLLLNPSKNLISIPSKYLIFYKFYFMYKLNHNPHLLYPFSWRDYLSKYFMTLNETNVSRFFFVSINLTSLSMNYVHCHHYTSISSYSYFNWFYSKKFSIILFEIQTL